MIKKIPNNEIETAKKIRRVFQISYPIEAELLKATYFPPLHRKLEDFVNSINDFFGYYKDQELVAVIEIDHKKDSTHIQSLVVDPEFFRQGIAQELIEFVFNTYESELFTVETGAANGPASKLYRKLNFTEVKQYETDHGIRKVSFQKKMRT